jgi:signal peptidase I
MKYVYRSLYTVLVLCLIAFALLLLTSAAPVTGVKTYVVQSGSMEPSIKTGSIVVVRADSTYQKGDVITFGPRNSKKAPTTHRIVDTQGTSYITQGDANNAPDQNPVRKTDIVGKVWLDVPYVGYAVTAAKQPLGFVVIVVIPALVVAVDEIKKIVQELKKSKAKRLASGANVIVTSVQKD